MPLSSDEERFKVEFKETGDYIRHYSTVRSALTTFLLTVAAAGFSAFFDSKQSPGPPFLWIAGHIFLCMSLAVCFTFSCRTEEKNLWQIKLLKWASTKDAAYPNWDTEKPTGKEIAKRVCSDLMNWFLVLLFFLLVGCFWWFKSFDADVLAAGVVIVLTMIACLALVAILFKSWLKRAENKNEFVRAATVLMVMFVCVAAVAIFLIVAAAKEHFVWALVGLLVVAALAIYVSLRLPR